MIFLNDGFGPINQAVNVYTIITAAPFYLFSWKEFNNLSSYFLISLRPTPKPFNQLILASFRLFFTIGMSLSDCFSFYSHRYSHITSVKIEALLPYYYRRINGSRCLESL